MKDKSQYTLDISWLLWQFAYFEFELHLYLSSFEFWWDTELQTKRKTFFNWNWGIFVFFIIINRRRYLSYTHVHLPSNRVVGTWGPDFADCFNPRGGGVRLCTLHFYSPHLPMDFQTFPRPCFKSCTRKWIHWSFSSFAYLPFCLIHMPFFTFIKWDLIPFCIYCVLYFVLSFNSTIISVVWFQATKVRTV